MLTKLIKDGLMLTRTTNLAMKMMLLLLLLTKPTLVGRQTFVSYKSTILTTGPIVKLS